MRPLDIVMRAPVDANAAQHAKFPLQEYRESAAIAIVSPSASNCARGKHGQRRQKRRASEAVKSVLSCQMVPKHSCLRASWHLSRSAAAKGKPTIFLRKQDRHSNTQQVAR